MSQGDVRAKTFTYIERQFWFHGFTFNATPGSRTALSGTVYNGSLFCLDPEAADDNAAVSPFPTGMSLAGQHGAGTLGENGDTRYVYNVTQPATGILDLFAGILVSAPPEGLTATQYGTGMWVTLAVRADMIPVRMNGTTALVYTGATASLLIPTDASWGASVVAMNAATVTQTHQAFGRPLRSLTPAAGDRVLATVSGRPASWLG